MTPERLKQIASWISDDPDFYLLCTEREATDAIKDLLTLTSEQATEMLGKDKLILLLETALKRELGEAFAKGLVRGKHGPSDGLTPFEYGEQYAKERARAVLSELQLKATI